MNFFWKLLAVVTWIAVAPLVFFPLIGIDYASLDFKLVLSLGFYFVILNEISRWAVK